MKLNRNFPPLAVISALCGITIMVALQVHGAPGDPPQVDPVGACCRGFAVPVVIDITAADCRVLADGDVYKWVEGDFDPTDNDSPCIQGAVD